MLELLVKLAYEIFSLHPFKFNVHHLSCYMTLNFLRYLGLLTTKKIAAASV